MIVCYRAARASTVFAPLTAGLADRLSWRSTYLVLALTLAAVTILALALKAPWPKAASAPHATGGAGQVARSRPFWMLATTLTLSAFAVYAVVALVPLLLLLLLERGPTTAQAAWPLGLGGAGQTLGRTLYTALARRTAVTARTMALIALGSATAALAIVPGPSLLLMPSVAGMVRGNLTLLQATAIADRWGTTHYGHLAGLLAARATAASALAPFVGAALSSPLGAYPALFSVLALPSGIAALIAYRSAPTNTHIPDR